jgi:quinol monooxygenase YgiN
MSNQVSWRVELVVKPGQGDNFQALTREMVESTRKEVGALSYERFASEDVKSIHAYERYADSAAAVAHLKEFKTKYGARFSSMVERRAFTVYGNPSDELRELLDGFGVTYMKPYGALEYWP